MSPLAPTPLVNGLLVQLPRDDRDDLLTVCVPCELEARRVLCVSNETLRFAYFPLDSWVATTCTVDARVPIAVDMVGAEGMLGATLALGVVTAPARAEVFGEGRCLRVSAPNLLEQIRTHPALGVMLRRYVHVRLTQVGRNVGCIGFHDVESRLSRCLLMAHDRARGRPIHLTHQMLAGLLGVQRSAITIAAGNLHACETIRYRRGDIEIVSRARLGAKACACYAASLVEYRRRMAA